MAQLFAQLFVFGALLFAGDVFFGAGLSAISFCGSHLDTLTHRGSHGYLLHDPIKSANTLGIFTIVETIGKLVHVERQIILAHLVVGSDDTVLEQAPEILD